MPTTKILRPRTKSTNDLTVRAKQFCDAGRFDEAWDIAEKMMEERHNEANPVILGSYVCWKMRRLPVAYHLAVRGSQIAPHEAASWINLGIAAQEMWLSDEAEDAYKTALRLAKNDAERGMVCMNLSAMYIDTGKWVDAEKFARQALKYTPNSQKSKANLGFALLGQRRWDGWDWYSYSLGLTSRKQYQYGSEPVWDGSKDKVVALYGEQGLGDEISFASIVSDAQKDCKKLIVDCDPKLEGLFRRSFPVVKVYGTRNAKEGDYVKWSEDDWSIDASMAIGELGGLYRKTDESFTGEPYLVPDPDRRVMWRSLFDKKSKPCIGIAWSGGIPQTGEKFRTLSLDTLHSVLRSVDAHWVSLQYKDASKEIREFKARHPEIDIVQYPWATLTKDYDDTAAMVAELDLVISVDTSMIHLSGALGKECWVLLHKYSQWRFSDKGDSIPWYKSVKVFRQRSLQDWNGPLGEVTHKLRQRYAVLEAA